MMLKNILILVLLVVFSCQSTHRKEQADALNRSLSDCLTDFSLTADELAKRKKYLKAEEKYRRLDSLFRQKVRHEKLNGNVLIAQQGVVLYRNSFGYAHIEQKDTLRPESKFQLASLSKTFTAVAILKLYEAGKLRLDDSVRKFIPQFPYSGIQIQSLLSHRSGLPNYAYILGDSLKKRNPYPTNDDLLRWYCAVKPKLYNLPNHYFSYSNTNYALLATIVEKVAGVPFEDFLHQQIFEPLGMKNTYLVTSRAEALNQFRTAGYQYNRRLAKDNYDDIVGDKGVYSTTDDILRWYAGLNGGCVLNPQTLKEAFTPRSFERRGSKNYGYGFRMHVDEATRQPKYIYHTGWWKGYNTLMWFSPKDKFVIILLSNRYNRSIYQIKPILEILEEKQAVTEGLDDELF
ncbi:MAG: serine hydrolase domain-containing protein [Runella sp.]